MVRPAPSLRRRPLSSFCHHHFSVSLDHRYRFPPNSTRISSPALIYLYSQACLGFPTIHIFNHSSWLPSMMPSGSQSQPSSQQSFSMSQQSQPGLASSGYRPYDTSRMPDEAPQIYSVCLLLSICQTTSSFVLFLCSLSLFVFPFLLPGSILLWTRRT